MTTSAQTTYVKFIKDYWAVTLFGVVLFAGIILFTIGWRIGPNGSPVLVGTLVIENAPTGTYAYLDEIRRVVAHDGIVRTELMPGSHSVIVDAPGMQPWNEVFTVVSGQETKLVPLFIPKEPSLRILKGAEREAARISMLRSMPPTKAAPLTLLEGCAEVYTVQNRLVADPVVTPSCTPPEYLLCPAEEGGVRDLPCPSSTVIFPSSQRIDSVAPFPGRDDALLVAAGTNVYVLELDPRYPQFIAPLLKGERVRVTGTATSTLLSDQERIYEFVP